MPPKTSSTGSKLLARYGNRLRQSHEAHKNDEMRINDFSTVPPGIQDGVAQLVKCGFREVPATRKENVGEIEFFASAVAEMPETHIYEDPPGSKHMKEVKVRGKQIYYQEVLADTPNAQGKKKTFDDHYDSILNIIRILGTGVYDTSGMSVEEVETAAEVISKAKPRFKYRSSLLPAQSGQEPRVYVSWDVGPVADDYEPPTISADVDNTAKPSANGMTKAATPIIAEEPDTEEPAADLEFGDIDSLLATATEKDGTHEGAAAQGKLRQMALDAGMSEEDVDSDDSTWEQLADYVKSGGSSEEGPTIPVKGEIWKTQLIDPKTKKKSNKLSKVEIVAVSTSKQSCDVKDLQTKKLHNSIPFSDLIEND